jgi:hypothetical protein
VRRRGLPLLLILAGAPVAWGAAPTVDYVYPAGGRQGAKVAVTAGGKLERWPLQFWADHPGIKAEFAAEKGKLSIQIDPAVAPGPHLVRLYDAQGPCAPRVFMVGTQPEVIEAEPNDEVAKAQAVDTLPAVMNGRLEKSGDVDSYAVKLEAGQCLCAAVQGRRIGAPMDPLLHLYDAAGNQIGFVHDGLGLDPLLVYRAEKSGSYVVRVAGFKHPPAADVKLTGEPGDVYRLSLSTAPVVRYAMPAGVKRGSKGVVRLFGWDGGELGSREVDATGATAGLSVATDAGDGTFAIDLGDGPELTESEVNSPVTAPCAVTGRLARPGEEGAFRFAAKKGERLVVEASSVAVASPMDAVLRIEDESGKELANNDDLGPAGDAKLDWTAPADGVYRAVVSDRFGKGGDEYVYRVSLRTPAPGVVATADADEYRVAPGKTVSIKLNVSRTGGYAGGLVAVATGLPAGVTATAVEVPEKGGDVTLSLTAAADAKPAAGPLRIMLLGTDPKSPAAFTASCTLKKEAGQEMIERTDALWLTVPAP